MKKLTTFILFSSMKWAVVLAFIMLCRDYAWFRYEYSILLSFVIFTIFVIHQQKHILALIRLFRMRNKPKDNPTFVLKD